MIETSFTEQEAVVNLRRTRALYAHALKTIPLASQTSSKSSMQYVLNASPLILERGEGCLISLASRSLPRNSASILCSA